MAIINYSSISLPEPGDPPIWVYQWGPMALNDVGVALREVWNYADRSVQIEGTFGAAGACTIEGSNDSVNYRVLNDVFANPLLVNAASIKEINELTRYIRPRITAGDGTTSLAVTMLMRRSTPHV